MPAGRPTDYDASYCEQVVEWGKLGKSKTWMAANLDVTRVTIDNWAVANPEFLCAIMQAMAHAQAWWEDQGQSYMLLPHQGGTFNGSVWSRSMAARFPEDWREKSETTLQGPNGGAVRIVASSHDEAL